MLQGISKEQCLQELSPITCSFPACSADDSITCSFPCQLDESQTHIAEMDGSMCLVISTWTLCSQEHLQDGMHQALLHVSQSSSGSGGSSSMAFFHDDQASFSFGAYSGSCSVRMVSCYAWSSSTKFAWDGSISTRLPREVRAM